MASPSEHALRCLIGNILDDLLLIDSIIKFARQMNKLEKKLIDIEVKRPDVALFALELFI